MLLEFYGSWKTEARLSSPFFFLLLLGLEGEMSDSRGGLSILWAAVSLQSVFSPRTALLLGPVWYFSALSLWGSNINKGSLRVYQLLKLSRSLPITVTRQCVQHRNMLELHNSQQTWSRAKTEMFMDSGFEEECGILDHYNKSIKKPSETAVSDWVVMIRLKRRHIKHQGKRDYGLKSVCLRNLEEDCVSKPEVLGFRKLKGKIQTNTNYHPISLFNSPFLDDIRTAPEK